LRQRSDIAVIMHDLRGGGAERAMLRLTRGFLEAGRRVELVLFQNAGDYLAEIPNGATVVNLAVPRVFEGIPALGRHLALTRPKALLSAHTHINVAAAMARRLCSCPARHVGSERNQISQKAAAARGLRARAVYAAAPLAYRMIYKIAAVSDGVARDLQAFAQLPASKVAVIYNPVFDADIKARLTQPMLHPWAGHGGAPFVLAVGRLATQKDFATLLRAFALARQHRALRLLILGEGPLRDDLANLARNLGLSPHDVSMPGFVSNPLPYMARCAAFALSSRFEGFPNVLVEALAAGARIVATQCPSGPDEILADGRFGVLTPVGDAPAFAAALERVLAAPHDPQRQIERASRFSVQRAASEYLSLLEGEAQR